MSAYSALKASVLADVMQVSHMELTNAEPFPEVSILIAISQQVVPKDRGCI